MSSDAFLFALFLVAVVNTSRYISTLRTLLAVMRECDPLLYQQVDGRGFFLLKVMSASKSAYFTIFVVSNIKSIMIRSSWLNALKCANFSSLPVPL